jgi:hypothetical protein
MNTTSALAGMVLLTTLALSIPAIAEETPAAPIEVGSDKQLFIDSLFFESASGVRLQVNPATKTGEQNVVRDRPWESATLNWFSVMEDRGGTLSTPDQPKARYRMWYEAYDIEGWPNLDDTSFCYAESADGITWTKPALDLFSYQGSTKNNILFRQIGPEGARSRVHGSHVFKDPAAPPEQRYKAVSQGIFEALGTPPYRVAGMYSPDGLTWTRYPDPICDIFGDSQYSAVWDEGTREYVLFGRVSGRGRALGRSTSKDLSFFEPLQLVLQTDEKDPWPRAGMASPGPGRNSRSLIFRWGPRAALMPVHSIWGRDSSALGISSTSIMAVPRSIMRRANWRRSCCPATAAS